MKSLFALAVILVLVECNNGSPPDLTGNWTYSATFRDTAPVLNCSTTGGALQLMQSGPQVTGTYSGLTWSCTGAVNASYGPYSGNVASGTITGGTVLISFDVQSCCGGPGSSWQNTGTVTGGTMSGSMLTVVSLSGTNYSLFGTWSATQQ